MIGIWYWGLQVEEVLTEAAFGWNVWCMNTQVVIWCVWWPTWIVGMISLLGKQSKEVCDNNYQDNKDVSGKEKDE